MKEELLGEICDFSYGEGLREDRRKPGKVPVYGSNGIVGWHDQAVTKGPTIVIGRKGSIGEVHFSPVPCWPIDTTYYIESPKRGCDLRWLYRALVALDLTQLNKAAAVPGLNREDAYRRRILFPEVCEQKRIATLLEKADQLRLTRRYARQLSDTFLQSVFLEMFGDPVTNPKNWENDNLRSLCVKFSDGPFGSNLKSSHYTHEGVRVVRLQNIGVGDFIDDDKAFISRSHFAALAKHECVPGDVLIGTLGDPNLRACLLPPAIPLALNKADCVQARVDEKRSNREYVRWLLNIPSTIHLAPGMAHGETRTRISMGRLAVLPVPVPPLPLQQKFADIVRRFERLRAQQREAERQAEHLFQTLLHHAFNCDL
jgi:type I restriction enzyme S subunit